jgi:predicted  nucleic acid-binding Zn-ribbon protein
MPTGYTHAVCEGKVTEFSEFAMQCARAFGALITMRDDPMDATIPDEIVPDTRYYDERIDSDMNRMRDVQAMSNAEADAAAAADYEQEMESQRRYLADKEIEASRLNDMMMKVRDWTPPTSDHVEMKSFMLEQLRISLPGDYAPAVPERLDGKTWRRSQIDSLAASVARNKEEREKEIGRARGRTEWVKALRSSLSIP